MTLTNPFIEIGIEKGIEKGCLQGEGRLVLRLLRLRFGTLDAEHEAMEDGEGLETGVVTEGREGNPPSPGALRMAGEGGNGCVIEVPA